MAIAVEGATRRINTLKDIITQGVKDRIIYPSVAKIVTDRSQLLFNVREVSTGAVDAFSEEVRDGKLGIITASHDSLANIIGSFGVVDDILRKTGKKGVMVPIARSLDEGQQEEGSRQFQIYKHALRQHHILPVKFVRALDLERYHMIGRTNAAAMEVLLEAYENDYLILHFPEGTTESGRFNAYGERIGLVVPVLHTMGKVIGRHIAKGIDFVGLPIGTFGSFHINDPNTRRTDPEVVKSAFALHPKKVAAVNIGQKYSPTDFAEFLERENVTGDRDPYLRKTVVEVLKNQPELWSEFVMKEQIAPLVPEHFRGAYRKK